MLNILVYNLSTSLYMCLYKILSGSAVGNKAQAQGGMHGMNFGIHIGTMCIPAATRSLMVKCGGLSGG